MSGSSIPEILRERASLQPNDTAFTFVDYESDWDGVSTTLTWAQLYRRTTNLARELSGIAKTGDRAVIVAPQGLEYLVAFLGSLEAGLIAVPLSIPMVGASDERVTAVLRDAAPTVVFTTSSIADTVAPYVQPSDGRHAATLLEVDRLDLDTRNRAIRREEPRPETAYLQYTSGSTRTPAGVMVTNRNLAANFEQIMRDFFPEYGKVSPPGTTAVSWLPFYHDMGLILGVCAPILGGWQTVVTTPLSFLARPARWMQLVAGANNALTAGPNFAFELAAGRTSDEDMAGLDLSRVVGWISGAERVHDATLKRFIQRFSKFGLSDKVIKPCFGLAEATLYVATRTPDVPKAVSFDLDELSAGNAIPTESTDGTPLVSYGVPLRSEVRIVDPEARSECPAGKVGEIWLYGDNICLGYWDKPEQTEETFNGVIEAPSADTPAGPWLRTGDLGFIFEDELYVVGRIKDLLIVRGRNHYPDDIEATITEITGGRVAAISVQDDRTEQLVAIIEVKKRGDTDAEILETLQSVKRDVTSAISTTHGLTAADLVLVSRGSIPITTSGKIRRSACAEQYRKAQFARLDEELASAGTGSQSS
ncbi:AMP-binding protein [Mycobacterium sp. AZCC_0083]|uniref:AMP-binding protein n=1 Tax=Mycobacterium sp. AZCC_0083 TaxID=2735882 RepID=UPI001620E4F8|nr:AMP-binding protein [Mycobacterium sp. AZCC_0083]MBB5160258.1 acyl-CoA synthetase (AMP-forming)/AMP-acid ligase II [Mycobacterium sp. AZCC_0083]